MLKRTLFFTSRYNLSLKSGQIVCATQEAPQQQRTIPIEDVGFVLLEHPSIHITLPLLNELAAHNVAVVLCDNKQLPSAVLQPLVGNTVQNEVMRSQLAASEPLKKALWKQTIEAKIKNQARLLNKLGYDGELLRPLYSNVKSGDSDNREGVAARLYWQQLFGKGFVRQREGEPPNNLLNYGYTLLRAAVARSLVGSGLLPALGIFHHNRYNPFPLADDIMEPYRPYVDEIVYRHYFAGDSELTKEMKGELLRILFVDCHFSKVCRPLEVGLTSTTASLVKCLQGEAKRIAYPLLQ